MDRTESKTINVNDNSSKMNFNPVSEVKEKDQSVIISHQSNDISRSDNVNEETNLSNCTIQELNAQEDESKYHAETIPLKKTENQQSNRSTAKKRRFSLVKVIIAVILVLFICITLAVVIAKYTGEFHIRSVI